MFKDECEKYILSNENDVLGFIEFLYTKPLQTRKNYAKIIEILPNDDYLKEFTKFLNKNEKEILSLEYNNLKQECINEITYIYSKLILDHYSEKTMKKIKDKHDQLLNMISYSYNEFSKENYNDIIYNFNNYISSHSKSNLTKKYKNIKKISLLIVSLIIMFFLIGSIPKVKYEQKKDGVEVTGITGLIFPFHLPVNKVEIKGNKASSIGEGAFAGENIKHIILSQSIFVIKDNAFANCVKLERVDSYVERKMNVTLEDNSLDIISLGKNAFANCVSLKEITLTPKLRSINGDPFSGCQIDVYFDGTYLDYISTGCYINHELKYKKITLRVKDEYDVMGDFTYDFYRDTVVSEIELPSIPPRDYIIEGVVDKDNNLIFGNDGKAIIPFKIYEDIDLYFKLKLKSDTIIIKGIEEEITLYFSERFKIPYKEIEGMVFIGYFSEENGKGMQWTNKNGDSFSKWYGSNSKTFYPYYLPSQFVIIDIYNNEQIIKCGELFSIELAPCISYYEKLWNCEFLGYALYDSYNKIEVVITDSNGVGVTEWKWDVNLELCGYFKDKNGNKFLRSYDDLFIMN